LNQPRASWPTFGLLFTAAEASFDLQPALEQGRHGQPRPAVLGTGSQALLSDKNTAVQVITYANDAAAFTLST
jgi:hypothetical protein